MLQSDARFAKLSKENPEINECLSDPSFLSSLSKAARNPKLMQEVLRNQDRALSNIESLPGGFNHLSSMFKGIDEPASSDPSTGSIF